VTTTVLDSAGLLFNVTAVTDGDTIRVLALPDGEKAVRLIGIDAPETGECMAAEAAARLEVLILNEQVRLELDASDRDQYGRLLRYVYLGSVLVNEVLVREGLALARRFEPDVAYADAFETAQDAAQAARVGMWASDACGPATGAAVSFGVLHYDAEGGDDTNPNDEWFELINQGDSAVDLTGWVVRDESAAHRYSFPAGFTLNAGGSVRVHTGCGADTAADLHWCVQGSAVWNNDGDTAFLLDPSGNIVAHEGY
jgi:endonuclease YncB( thermonuclease family)